MKFVHKMGQQLKHLNLYQMNPTQSIECPSQDHTPHDQVLGKRQNNLWRGMKGDLAFLDALPRQLSSALSYK